MPNFSAQDVPDRAGRREWTGLAVLACACVLGVAAALLRRMPATAAPEPEVAAEPMPA